MRVIVWIFYGLGAAAIAAVLRREQNPRETLALAALGVMGAVVGGLVSRAVSLSADPTLGGSAMPVVAGAVLALGIYHLARSSRVPRRT